MSDNSQDMFSFEDLKLSRKGGMCIIPIVIKLYKKSDSSLGVFIDSPQSSKDFVIKNGNSKYNKEASGSKELSKGKYKNENKSEKSLIKSTASLRNEDRKKSKFLNKTIRKDADGEILDGESSEEIFTVCPSIDSKGKLYSSIPEISKDDSKVSCVSSNKLTQTSIAVLKKLDVLRSKSVLDFQENVVEIQEKPKDVSKDSSLHIEIRGSDIILSKYNFIEESETDTESEASHYVSTFYESQMQALHKKLKDLKYHLQESKCPRIR